MPKGGSSIRIWQDPWVPLLPSFRPNSLLPLSSASGDLDLDQRVDSFFN